MIYLDSHQHFWKYNPAEYVWMTDQMEVLRRDYFPGHPAIEPPIEVPCKAKRS